MSYEHIWVLIAVFTLALWAALAIVARHLRDRKRLAVREMIHQERMAALDKGVQLSELPADLASGTDPETETTVPGHWVQRGALAGAFILILGGMGLSLSLALIPQTPELKDLHAMAALGGVPVLIGLGLLLYTWVDRLVFGRGRA